MITFNDYYHKIQKSGSLSREYFVHYSVRYILCATRPSVPNKVFNMLKPFIESNYTFQMLIPFNFSGVPQQTRV